MMLKLKEHIQNNTKRARKWFVKTFCIKDYNTYGIKCEDLLKHYIGVRNANLKNFAQKLNVNKEIIQYIPDSIDINDIEKNI